MWSQGLMLHRQSPGHREGQELPYRMPLKDRLIEDRHRLSLLWLNMFFLRLVQAGTAPMLMETRFQILALASTLYADRREKIGPVTCNRESRVGEGLTGPLARMPYHRVLFSAPLVRDCTCVTSMGTCALNFLFAAAVRVFLSPPSNSDRTE